jgi:hypothetical protein
MEPVVHDVNNPINFLNLHPIRFPMNVSHVVQMRKVNYTPFFIIADLDFLVGWFHQVE